ncbi:hypothetical protein IRJ41_023222 [Triplophysa rosa]|uniref:Uncharacterized protein n=1 Tax=Triplophysa rosa TaxID=992332 RepID=A0A9W7X408_TRIRA|nr:hypothetical protein IRJ41_023222 [Triplophysa rosa]
MCADTYVVVFPLIAAVSGRSSREERSRSSLPTLTAFNNPNCSHSPADIKAYLSLALSPRRWAHLLCELLGECLSFNRLYPH